MQIRTTTMRVALSLLGIATAAPAFAQDYPERTIRFISPTAAGGGNDIFARLSAQKLSEAFGKSVIVENRPGGGTIIGTEIVAKALADGHTIIMVTTNFIINPGLVPKLPYDSMKDLAPVALLASAPLVLVLHPSIPAKTVGEFVALAKRRPGEINYASSGNGTAGHLAGVLMDATAGTKMTHIPYKSTAPALIDVLSGQVQMFFVSTPSVQQHLKSGKLRGLAVTSTARSSLLPELPTMAEAGVKGYDIAQIYGVLAPGGTPPAIVNRLNAALTKALKSPDVIERLRNDGADAVGGPPEQFAQYIRTEIPKWIKVIRESGARID